MMKKIHMIAAACAALFVTGCTAFAPAEADAETEVKAAPQYFTAVEQQVAAEALNAGAIQAPGVHVSSDLCDTLHVNQPASVSYDEDGMLRVRVVADTDELPFFTWLICPNRTYKITYRFVWFDESGKIRKGATPVDCREVMPGDPVRFSAKSADPNSKKFALILTPGCSGACKEADKK